MTNPAHNDSLMQNNPAVHFVENADGPTLGYVSLPLIEQDGLIFKDMERSGKLEPYEDWRLEARERAKDLASRLSVEEIAGLMMYSPHQMVPTVPGMPFTATYDGKDFPNAGVEPWELTDQLKDYLNKNHIRHVLAMYLQNTDAAARWNNAIQAFCESQPHSIPTSISSDPRHGAGSADAEYKSDGSDTSKWPQGMGMAATFDPELCKQAARVIAQEYRALGISTALSPQVDLGTEPRWMRVEDTFGQSPELVTAMSQAYCDGIQTNPATRGWGIGSVNAMAKHWPGGGPCEGGRDAHYAFGKYAVYPGKNLSAHLKPFLEGAFNLQDGTRTAASVMPYYTVSWGIDPTGNNVGNSYSHYIIHDMLREKYGYEGVICTDWGITQDPEPVVDSFGSRCYGVEDLSEAERHLRIIENGVDQFGGNNDIRPILEAYHIGCESHSEATMRARFEESATRLLTNMFRCGLFENPYTNPEESIAIVGNKTNSEAGFAAQLKSIVMIKNANNALPLRNLDEHEARLKVYVPPRHTDAHKGFSRNPIPAQDTPGANLEALERFYNVVDSPQQADFALCFVESPMSDGYDGETGYQPVSLQYRPYTATTSRKVSIAGGDFREESTNRSYLGKTTISWNESDLDLVINTRKSMGDKPVVAIVRVHHPSVMSELEPYADAILVDFGVQQDAITTVVSGNYEPSGLLPADLPANMETVETHSEDVPFDYEPFTDSQGNEYAFGFGLNWSGKISDERTAQFTRNS